MINRPLTDDDLATFERLRQERPGRSITVYSSHGFVPNAYRYACAIERIVYRDCYPDGETHREWADAHRAFGRGSLVVVR